MTKSKKKVAEQAAESTTAFNPIVGIQRTDLMRSFRKFLGQAAKNPGALKRQAFKFTSDLMDVAQGNSDYEPNPRDRRFTDEAWKSNGFYRRSLQAWLALHDNLTDWLDAIEMSDVDKARTSFLLNLVADTLSPTNTLVGNPAALKKMIDTGGKSLVKGAGNLMDDIRHGNGLPKQVDNSSFVIGQNMAATPGHVVFRNEMLELLQYKPQTKTVNKIPLMLVPPQINKFYVQDLSPGKSQIDWLVKQGHQVFAISWRNPDESCSHWGLADYVEALVEASDAVLSITRKKKLNVSGACSGGITLASFLSRLKATGDKRINAATFMVCVLDPRKDDTEIGLFLDDESIEMARRSSAKKGLLRGEDLARIFAWMRPNDLIWSYVVNNYLLGEDPPAFDILAWNGDTTNLPAQLHSDYLDLYLKGPFRNPGSMELGGHPLDISDLGLDTFVVSGTTDHITPWKACFRSARLMNTDTTFVLSNSGHIQAILNPPTNPRASYLTASFDKDEPEDWSEGARLIKESWWLRWSDWLEDRGGGRKNAPRSPGNKTWPALDEAPGRYVRDN